MKKVIVNVCTRDRPTELAMLLWSLREQTFQDFDVFVLDDVSGTPLGNFHFLNVIVNKLKEEGHIIEFERAEFNHGVSKARQKLAMKSKDRGYEYILRVDDDVILERDYIEKLFQVIDAGYDLASGITPYLGGLHSKRQTKYLKGIANRIMLKDGAYEWNGDDCGMQYVEEEILPMHHFRSCALYKTIIHEKADYQNTLSKHGFREEQVLSLKMLLSGFKLGCHTGAIAWHLMTPSGGERFANSNELVAFNQKELDLFTKKLWEEHGDFIAKYNHSVLEEDFPRPDDDEFLKETNLAKVRI
jgi:GT2 family glycosyltransferase